MFRNLMLAVAMIGAAFLGGGNGSAPALSAPAAPSVSQTSPSATDQANFSPFAVPKLGSNASAGGCCGAGGCKNGQCGPGKSCGSGNCPFASGSGSSLSGSSFAKLNGGAGCGNPNCPGGAACASGNCGCPQCANRLNGGLNETSPLLQ
ncbi:MAG: hypothetical protein HY816_08140 [Candidatus Wallbacteria bacterium]|nr:hypothetical protein [Candidatus Wallbacteria bacterium]